MILYNSGALIAALYGAAYLLPLSLIFGFSTHMLLLALALGDITLRWLLVLAPHPNGDVAFKWLPSLLRKAGPPEGGLPSFFIERLFIPSNGGTIFFIPVWIWGIALQFILPREPSLE